MQSVLNPYQKSTFTNTLTFGKSDLNARRNFLDEVKGEGNSINYEFRMHDPRIGRFFAVDPLTAKYPHYSPYSFSGNKVIAWRELEGLEEFIAIDLGNAKYLIIWDIKARGRKGEAGKIEFRTTSGEVIQKMRNLGQRESKYAWFTDRLKANPSDNNVTHHETGTSVSNKYKGTKNNLPSTLLGQTGEMIHSSDVLDVGEPPVPTKEPVPVINNTSNTPDAAVEAEKPSEPSTQKYKYIVIYRKESCGCDEDGKAVGLTRVPVNKDGEVDWELLRKRTSDKVIKMDEYRESQGLNRSGSGWDVKHDEYEYKLLDGQFESDEDAWEGAWKQRNKGQRKGITRKGEFTGPKN
jgi:hypothetical protein